jgi:hypothetical protein
MSLTIHSVPVTAAKVLGIAQKPKADLYQPRDRRRWIGFPGRHDEHPGHVVGAIPVPCPGLGEPCVLEGATLVRHPTKVGEIGLRI